MAKNESAKQEVGSAFDLLPKSWEIVKKNWQAFAVVNILTLISALFPYDNDAKDKKDSFNFQDTFGSFSGIEISAFLGFGLVIIVLVIIISIYLFTMATILEVESTSAKRPSISHLFEKAKKYWLKLLGLMIIITVIIIAGFILLIIPGIIALARLSMAPYLMIDKDLSISEAMTASNEMGKKYFWQVLGAVGVTVLVAIATGFLGIIPIIGVLIGTLIAIAFSLVMPLRYQQLKKLG